MQRILAALVIAGLAGASWAESPAPSPSPAAAGREVTLEPGAGAAAPKEELGAPNPALKDQKTKASYAFGYKFGSELTRLIDQLGIDLDVDTLVMGIRDVIGQKKPSLSLKDMEENVKAYITETRKNIAEKNKTEGDKFLAENKAKKGVTTTKSGLQYEVIKEGTGKKPSANDTVTTHYRGTLINGTEFDSSYGRGQPTTFPVNGVIPGWSEALQLMSVGSKWKLYVPSDLAYGPQGMPPKIQPNSTLVFEVELLDIKGSEKGAEKGAEKGESSPAASPSPESK